MRSTQLFSLFLVLLSAFSCQEQMRSTRGAAGPDIALRWENLGNAAEGGYGARFVLSNVGETPLPATGWAIYFSMMTADIEKQPAQGLIERISGDHFRLSPGQGMTELAPGDSISLEYSAGGSLIKEIMAPDNPYIVFTDASGAEQPPVAIGNFSVAPFTRPEQMTRGAGDKVPVPTPQSEFRRNEYLTLLPAGQVIPITPTPAVYTPGSGNVTIGEGWRIRHSTGLESDARYLQAMLKQLTGRELVIETGETADPTTILLSTGAIQVQGAARAAGSEAYTLISAAGQGIRITGSDGAGLFYGIQSLLALAPVDAFRQPQAGLAIPAVRIEDAPRFRYRGFHLDVARNFQSKEAVLKLLDLMAFYKLNKFHFHLTDDEGWRLEIAELPELTTVGARRGHTLDERDRLYPNFGSGAFPDPERSKGTGFYTRADFIEILRYARDRHIEVIPEVDMPGHSRAAIVSMKARQLLTESGDYTLHDPEDSSRYRSAQDYTDNVLCPCQESTYRFVETVVRNILGMYKEAAVPLSMFHIGGDEVPAGVWEGSPACARLIEQSPQVNNVVDINYYFVRRCGEILKRYGLRTAGWEEIALQRVQTANGVRYEPHPEFKGGNYIPFVWNNLGDNIDLSNRLANAGYPIVMCAASNLYFDLAYNKDPAEPGLLWGGMTDTRKAFSFVPEDVFKSSTEDNFGNVFDTEAFYRTKTAMTPAGARNILGIQAELWSETLREDWMWEYEAFPKFLGLSERAWSAQPEWARIRARPAREQALNQAWNNFANRVGRYELPRLDYLAGGVGYRISPPGAVIEDGRLRANSDFPGLTIRYTTDGSEPTASSKVYTEPMAVSGQVRLASFDTKGRKSRTVIVGK